MHINYVSDEAKPSLIHNLYYVKMDVWKVSPSLRTQKSSPIETIAAGYRASLRLTFSLSMYPGMFES